MTIPAGEFEQGKSGSYLQAVSCVPSGASVAVGVAGDGYVTSQPLVDAGSIPA